jgi:Ca2+-dependent lipid-binding protein
MSYTNVQLADWYHNTAVIIFACLSSWLVAVLGGGLAWVFLIMAICGTYYRTSIRRVRRNFRDDVNRELAKSKLETDTESLEWINSFLVKFWPIFQPVLAETIINSVDQVLSTSTPAFLDSLRMKTFTLGSKPPRMEHVKTYPKAEDDVVLMDWKFSFTPNDHADMTARQIKNKVNPKIVLEIRIGKAMLSKGLDVIVEDMAFSGLMRVKIKLQIPFPHVEKIEISFLERPSECSIFLVFSTAQNRRTGLTIVHFLRGSFTASQSPRLQKPFIFSFFWDLWDILS